MTQIVVIRGNSGSGKSCLAQHIRNEFWGSSMIVSQDVIRRDILALKDRPNNPAIELIYQMVTFGINRFDLIIVEGILNAKKYGDMLKALQELGCHVEYYYYKLDFEETYKRHLSKDDTDFGINELKAWWVENDVLNFECEYLIETQSSLIETTHEIIAKIPR